MLIRELCLENFQSHEYTEIDLSPGLTVIIGESDRGKSAVVRALRWLFLNEPRGSDFLRVGASGCRVTAVFDDGTKVIRERERNKNRYLIVYPEGRQEVYEGFGNSIPAEVTGLHGIGKVRLDDDLEISLNFALQLDSPFLLTDSGSTRAKAIGRLHGVHIVDAAVRATTRDMNKLQQEEKRLEEQLLSLDEKLKEFLDLPELQVKLSRCGSLLEQVLRMRERTAGLSRLKQNIVKTREEIRRVKERLESLKHLSRVEEMVIALEYKYRQAKKLAGLKNRLDINRRGSSQALLEVELTGKLDEGRKFLIDMERKYRRYCALSALMKQATNISGEKVLQAHIVTVTGHLSRAGGELDRLNKLYLKLEKIVLLRFKLGAVKKGAAASQFVLSVTENIEKALLFFEVLAFLPGKIDRLKNIRRNLYGTRQRLEKGKSFCHENKIVLTNLAQEYSAILKNLGKCPTCFREVDQLTIERILKGVEGGNGL